MARTEPDGEIVRRIWREADDLLPNNSLARWVCRKHLG
jgi:hypothetical protein